jgi:hypothetical protein
VAYALAMVKSNSQKASRGRFMRMPFVLSIVGIVVLLSCCRTESKESPSDDIVRNVVTVETIFGSTVNVPGVRSREWKI